MCECVSGLCPAMFLTGLLFFALFPFFFSRPVCGTTLEGEMGNGSACAFLLGSWIPGGLWLGRDLKIMGIGGDGSWMDGGGWMDGCGVFLRAASASRNCLHLETRFPAVLYFTLPLFLSCFLQFLTRMYDKLTVCVVCVCMYGRSTSAVLYSYSKARVGEHKLLLPLVRRGH